MVVIFLIGYPSEVGGACTEAWHTIRVWRKMGLDVGLIPTWGASDDWRHRCAEIGCVTFDAEPSSLAKVDGLRGSVVVSFCNDNFLSSYHTFRELGCKVAWANCMTFLFEKEREVFRKHGPPDACIFQSEFQKSELTPQLELYGYTPDKAWLIRGAFDPDEFEFSPRPHRSSEPFVFGRMARPDADKWSSNTWPIYSAVQYQKKRVMMLGCDERTLAKIGSPPTFADCLKPNAMPVQQFLALLHCLMPINGGARENWPRAGLEAMAAGVPVVAQNLWGWREMIEHGVTGFLADNDCELAHYTAVLAYDEPFRLRIAKQARERLVDELCSESVVSGLWSSLFSFLN